MRPADELPEPLRSRIDEFAAGEAEGLVTAALAQARARVLGELTDAISESLRRHAVLGMSPTGRAAAAPAPVAPAAPQPPTAVTDDAEIELAWYAYGVIRAGDASAAQARPGVDPRHPATTIVEGDLAAVVSRVSLADFSETTLRTHLSDMAWVEATARAHEHTLELVAGQVTLIPMRMCSVYGTEAAVREMLRREAHALADGLDQLAGKAEWGVKVFADARLRQANPAAQPAAFGAEDAPHAGTAYLSRKRDERDAAERADRLVEEAARQIHARLCTAASDARVVALQQTQPGEPEMILNAAYLVAAGTEQAFHECVHELQDTFGPLGVDLAPTGPWPAYNFVPSAIGGTW